jgi:drug/metabolite transporter (DMT)-like permease
MLGVCFMQEPSDNETDDPTLIDSTNLNLQLYDKNKHSIFDYCGILLSKILHSFSIGDLFCLGQALFFGIGYWRLEYIAQRFPKYSLHLTVGQVLAIWIGSIAYCMTDLGYIPTAHDVIGWVISSPMYYIIALVWTGMGSTAFALYLETLAMRAISASELTIIMTSISIWGTIFAFIVLGEVLSISSFFGGAFILSGCLLVTL